MFNIKIYEKDGVTYKNTIQIEKLESVSSFSSKVNGGYGNISFGLAYKINNTDIKISNIIKVQFKNDIIFIGSILNIKKTYGSKKEVILLNAIGLGSLPALLLTNTTFSDTASNIVKSLIDAFNIEYGSNILSYDALSIPNTTGILDLDFSKYVNYLKAIQEVADTAGLYFFIDINGKVFLKQKANFNKHTLTVGLDIDNLKIDEDSKDLVNSLILKNAINTKTYSDATSQTLYGKREKYMDKASDLLNTATADIYGVNYIATYKNETKKVSIIVNNGYNFFNIKGGDLISIRNVDYILNDLQVAKITYGLEKATIELEKSYSFAKEIFNP